MNNLYRKVAVTSVGIALTFSVGVNKEASSATFSLTDTSRFTITGDWSSGVGEELSEASFGFTGVERRFTGEPRGYPFEGDTNTKEKKAFYEFNIGNLSLAPNTIISSASLNLKIADARRHWRYLDLEANGYIGNGKPDLSDFNAGVYYLGSDNAFIGYNNYNVFPYERPELNYDVTKFINARISNRDTFTGFAIHVPRIYGNYGGASLGDAKLNITTVDVPEPVPEPTTIFGSALALSLGGWLKRKKLSQQNKTTPQH
jgi:hypothetical protein